MIYKSSLWINDIDTVLQIIPELRNLDGKAVLITGAGGLICSAVVDCLIRFNETHREQIQILAAARNRNRIKERFFPYCEKSYFSFFPYEASDSFFDIPAAADYIIHGASNAYSASFSAEPVETMCSNFVGTLALLNYAKEKGTRRLLFISSSEIYGNKENDTPHREEEYGYIDLLKSRSAYAIGKRAAETLCVSYAEEYAVESVIVRPGHIYGPTASRRDNRVSSEWAYSAADGKNIVMKSSGEQIRSYVYCLDCASAILKVLLCGSSSHAYNISNPDSVIDIRGIAEIIAKNGPVELIREIPDEKEQKQFNPMKNSSLDCSALLKLGWKGCFFAEEGFAHTVQIIRDAGKEDRC